jgi:hypothetical protein
VVNHAASAAAGVVRAMFERFAGTPLAKHWKAHPRRQ